MALSTMSPSSSSSSQTRLRSVWSKWSTAREKRKMLMLPTVMAAATEKVVMHRRSSPSQSQQIKSEDLTCSQFAHMAGIRILRDNDDEDDDDAESDNDDDDDDECAALTHGYGDQRVMATSVHMGRSFSDRSGARRSQPQIWDAAFWHNQVQQDEKMHQPQPGAVMMTPLHSYASTTSTTSSYSNPSSTCSSPPSLMRSGPSVIRKGRFKIVVGQDEDQQQNDVNAEPNYVEWRRKRSCTT
ncbi:hypothetical protein K492DRAFT_172449 [Lichtheimia hyalospora FSU 10163]|nr:hypothetical protein K492DRAFT_172449 [Lichtheimia hyalospora FSU 10163]